VEFGRHIGLKIRGFFKREGSSPSSPIGSSLLTNKEQESDMNTIKEINSEVKQLRETVGAMTNRINKLVDEIYVLRSEVGKFKSDVATDITTLENMSKGGL
tara:strand:- start:891 stop:1193 length:303 start_codon:yes stop_codon:yes gene_type:complete